MRVGALLEQLTDGCKRPASFVRQRTPEAAGGGVRGLLAHRATNIGEIPPRVLDNQFKRRDDVIDCSKRIGHASTNPTPHESTPAYPSRSRVDYRHPLEATPGRVST